MSYKLLLVGTGLLALPPAAPVATGRYFTSYPLGPHTWHHQIELQRHTFKSTQWVTGFFRPTTSVVTGSLRFSGDTVILTPSVVTTYVPGQRPTVKTGFPALIQKARKLTRHYEHRTTCRCQDLPAAPIDLPRDNEKINLCRRVYKFVSTPDSLVETSSNRGYFKRPSGRS